LPDDRWSCFKDFSFAVSLQEIAVRHLQGGGILADKNVYSKETVPEVSDLHPVPGGWFAEGVEDLFGDDGVERVTRMLRQLVGLLALLRCGHRQATFWIR
jgi:hypothetical protein